MHQKHGPKPHESKAAKEGSITPAAKKTQDTESGKSQSSTYIETSQQKFWGMTKFEWIMAALTMIGLVIAGFTGAIYFKQLGAMKNDQRAWVKISSGDFHYEETNVGTFVSVPITISNTGKTPAKDLVTQVVVEKVKNGQSPRFVYDYLSRRAQIGGVLFPNAQDEPITGSLLRPGSGIPYEEAKPLPLSGSELQELKDGNSYLAVYAETTYSDIFGTKHWYRFCSFAYPLEKKTVGITARKCTEYNSVDDN